jgi:hypothetical protein
MLRIVLPSVGIATPGSDPVSTVGNIRIPIEVIIDVNVDVVVSPSGPPAPTTTPSCTHCYTDAE